MSTRGEFYASVVRECIPDRDSSILVVAAGDRDKEALQGFGNVVFSNIDGRRETSLEDAESLSFRDASFDYVVIHAALHHCHSPHRALLEMYRVAKLGVLAIEARDSVLMRLLERFGLTDTYEHRGVYFKGGTRGGVRNSALPNFIYRWTEREVEKTVNTFAPQTRNRFRYFYGHNSPAQLLYPGNQLKKAALRLAYQAYRLFAWIFPRQQNLFGFLITKETINPWVSLTGGEYRLDMDWGKRHFDSSTRSLPSKAERRS